jgi:phage host-nuclease inhibitor protein Gam
MAGKSRKKTTIETSSLKSYDDVNATLLDMAKIQATLEKRLAKFNEEEALRRKVLQEFTNPLIAQIEEYHREIYLYCAENKKDFEKNRTMFLANGEVGFRMGTPKTTTLKKFTWKKVLEILEMRRLTRDIDRKPSINKDLILADFAEKKLTKEELAEMGMNIIQEESFWLDVKKAVETPDAT